MRLAQLGFALVIVVAGAPLAAHDDVVPYAFNGKILTGAHDDLDEDNPDDITMRVFGYDFGEVVGGNPYIIGDPGFNNSSSFTTGVFPNDGKLPAGSTLAFDLVTNLQYWDGAPGPVSFGPAPANVKLGLKNNGVTLLVDANGNDNNYPIIQTASGTGRVHDHMDETTLNDIDGTDETLPNPPAGIYVVGMRLKLQAGSGVADSDPIYFLFNNELSEEVHDEAMDWANVNLVPEPATWLTMMIATTGALVVGWRRRRRSA